MDETGGEILTVREEVGGKKNKLSFHLNLFMIKEKLCCDSHAV